MRTRILSALLGVAVAVALMVGVASPAWAGGISGQYRTTHASQSRDSIVVSAHYGFRADGSSRRSSGKAVATSNPNAPICTYMPLGHAGTKLLGKGGPEPGQWYILGCKWTNGYVGNPLPAVWIVGAPPAPPTKPTVLAEKAVTDLFLAGPAIGMSPPPNRSQIVNVSTWLWMSGPWRRRSATASAGPVSATATAVPYKVVWNMGDGHLVTCHGPGTKYNRNEPASGQSTNCSYTYSTPSSAAPGGRFTVTATVYYRVTWVAQGAPGGGNLGLIAGPSTQTRVLVEQAEALNTSGG